LPVINNIIINGSFNLNEQDIHYQNLVAFGLIWAVLLPKWPIYDEESDSQFQIFKMLSTTAEPGIFHVLSYNINIYKLIFKINYSVGYINLLR